MTANSTKSSQKGVQKGLFSTFLMILVLSPELFAEPKTAQYSVDEDSQEARVIRSELWIQPQTTKEWENGVLKETTLHHLTTEIKVQASENQLKSILVNPEPNYNQILVPTHSRDGQKRVHCKPSKITKNGQKENKESPIEAKNDQQGTTKAKNDPQKQQKMCSYDPQSRIDPEDHCWISSSPKGFQATSSLYLGSKPLQNTKLSITENCKDSPQWRLAETGVLGLGPQSPLYSSIRQSLSLEPATPLYTTFYLNTSQEHHWYEVFRGGSPSSIYSGSELRISPDLESILDNPKSGPKGIWLKNTAPQGKHEKKRHSEAKRMRNGHINYHRNRTWTEKWRIENVEIWSSKTQKTIFNGSACFSLYSNSTFLVRNPTLFNIISKMSVCGSQNCGGDSLILNGATYTLKMKDHTGKPVTVEISPREYLYHLKNGSVEVSVAQLDDFEEAGCDPDAEIGFGRMFFFFHQVVFKVGEGEEKGQIGLFDYTVRPALAKEGKGVNQLIAFGFGLLILVFLILITKRAGAVFYTSGGSYGDYVDAKGGKGKVKGESEMKPLLKMKTY